ncbi:hypothetical protein [Sphingomonas sp. NFX23]|uniref:hypothetical protein n=1 Tax=Sphingomonas sp. NFX23 TaxID=2819532 RepID=UPI003CF35DF8
MASLGSLIVDLALESAQFIAGMRNAAAQSNATGKAIAGAMNMAKGAIGGLVGVLSVDFLAGQTMAAYDFADAIVDLSDRTGASTKTIQEFRYAAQMSGSSVESADAAIQKFSKNLGSAQGGNKAMAATFKELGVNIREDADTSLRKFMDGIAKMPTIAMRQSKATEIMGKSAADLTVLLGNGSAGFDELAAAADRYGIVIDDSVLRNAGQVNDQLDTMKMILNAQMAGAIIQNADALMALANGFIAAASAAANFFQQMNVTKLASVANGVNMNSDIPTLMAGRLRCNSVEQTQEEARVALIQTSAGRKNRHEFLTNSYNANIRKGRNKNDMDMQAILAEREDIARKESASRRGYKPPPVTTTNLPKIGGGGKPHKAGGAKPAKSAGHERSAEEIEMYWRREFLGLENDLRDAQAELTNTPTARADAKVERLQNDWSYRASEIDRDTGTEDEIKAGKKRFTALQAKELHEKEQALYDAKYDATMRDRDAEISQDLLSVREAGYHNELDILNAQAGLARSTSARRDAALRIVDKEFELERIQLEAIQHSATASQAEKDIATARLAILDKLKGFAVQNAKEQNAGPGMQFLNSIPKTAGEINDQLEQVQVDGLEHLQEGLMGVIKGTESVGSAFSSMVSGILDGLLKIALQQAIIKPLAGLLFGGSSEGSGGGLLGGILGGIVKGTVKGARANGGMTSAGNYLVGERGPEIVQIGSNANVISNRGISGVAGANDNNGVQVNINGPITSNDPDMVRRMVFEGVAAATPMITKQATDATVSKLQRRNL